MIEVWSECRTQFGGESGYLYGDFTIADAMFAPVIAQLRTYGITLDGVAQAYSDTVWDSATMRTWRAAAEAEPWVTEKYEL